MATAPDLKDLRSHITGSYFNLRVGIGALGFALPIALWLGDRLAVDQPLRGSMSAYYYGATGDVFVGTLVAIGVFLYLYRGFSDAENLALDLAGVFAVGVALFPTAAEGEPRGLRSTLHGVCAVLFFACIAYVCIRRAPDTLSLIRDTVTARRYRTTYRALGIAMVVAPLTAAALALLTDADRLVFAVEVAGVWTFAAYWLLKSREMKETNAEGLALQGDLRVFTPLNPDLPGRIVQVAPAPEMMDEMDTAQEERS